MIALANQLGVGANVLSVLTDEQQTIICDYAKKTGAGYASEEKYATADDAWADIIAQAAAVMPPGEREKFQAIQSEPETMWLRACFVDGFNGQRKPFYQQPAGKKGLAWGAVGGAVGGLVLGGLTAWALSR